MCTVRSFIIVRVMASEAEPSLTITYYSRMNDNIISNVNKQQRRARITTNMVGFSLFYMISILSYSLWVV